MLYVERDQEGLIIGVRYGDNGKNLEKKSMVDEEVIEFLTRQEDVEPWVAVLSKSDLGIVRILEDLVALLVKKNIIMLTELPESAQAKLRERQQVREKMKEVSFMVDDVL